MQFDGLIKRLVATLLPGIAVFCSTATATSAFGYSSADVIGTWNCRLSVTATTRRGTAQGSMRVVVHMYANGTAAATYAEDYGGARGVDRFRWTYRPTGPSGGIITDPPGTGDLTWLSHNSVHVQRITRGTGLLEYEAVDCSRG